MDFNARVDVNCGRKDGQMENQMPISHLAKVGVTKSQTQPYQYNEKPDPSPLYNL